jgi:hypothetical protein
MTRSLRRIPAWAWYLSAYAVAILSFAVAYWHIPGHFYHPYVRHEEAMQWEERFICMRLGKAISKALVKNSPENKGVEIKGSSAWVTAIAPDNAFLRVQALVVIASKEDSSQATLATITLRLPPIAVNEDMRDGVGSSVMFPILDSVGGAFIGTPASDPTLEVALRSSLRRIEGTQSDVEAINAFIAGHEGFPSRVPDSFGRMLYLSVVTITTVGYGDIVPLTGKARTLVGLEATLGIVLLGLFIGSLASGKSNVKHTEPVTMPPIASPPPRPQSAPIQPTARSSLGQKVALGALLISAVVILAKRRQL